MIAWLFLKLGWLPHLDCKWAEVHRGREVVIHHGDRNEILTPAEAMWLGSELILAGRLARRKQADEEPSA